MTQRLSKKLNLEIIFMILFIQIESTCYDYWKGNTLPAFTNNSYCRSIITWPVSTEVISTNSSRDATALAFYESIYSSEYKTSAIGKQCLGILQFMACAYAYPTCTDTTSTISDVCSWLCSLAQVRCGTSSQAYISVCLNGNTAGSSCSGEFTLLLSITIMILLLFL